jgi:molecular chaperone DnaK (HSP70)
MWPMVKRGTTVPTKKHRNFTTAVDDQTSVLIKVYEGERQQTNQTRLRGEIVLEGIAPAKKGVAQIEVSIEVSPHSMLKVEVSLNTRLSDTVLMNERLKRDIWRM